MFEASSSLGWFGVDQIVILTAAFTLPNAAKDRGHKRELCLGTVGTAWYVAGREVKLVDK